jgi:hypothetical protein
MSSFTIALEPVEGGNLVYAPLAPPTAGAPSQAQLALKVLIENTGADTLHVTGVQLSFSGGPAVATTLLPATLDVAPSTTSAWLMAPPYVLLPQPAPSSITIAVLATGAPIATATLPLAAHANPGPGGSFPFPARAGDLRPGEYWTARSAAHAAAGDGSQMFAYDMGVVAWNGVAWIDRLPGTDGTRNEHFRIWGKPIYAMAAGTVVDFRNDIPTNPTPGSDLSPPQPVEGNHFYLQHGSELVLYAHLQPGSLNADLLTKGAVVSAGQFLGLAGNSGNSSGPHLHTHAIKATKPWGGPPRPLLWRDIHVVDRGALHPPSPAGPWTKLAGKAMPPVSSAVWPAVSAPAWYPPGWPEVGRHGIPAIAYQAEFDKIVSSGYRPVWVDAYDVDGETFFNAIFRPADGTAWVARHGMTGAGYQAEWDTWVKSNGYRPLNVEAYRAGGKLRYSAIFVKTAGPSFQAYHGVSETDHQQRFDQLVAQGFRPVNLAVVTIDGARRYAGYYEQRDVGTFVAQQALAAAAYQAAFDANAAAGRHLAYVNAYSDGSGPRFSAIWQSEAPAGPARHGMSSSDYQAKHDTELNAGRLTRAVTGYESGSTARFAAYWTR